MKNTSCLITFFKLVSFKISFSRINKIKFLTFTLDTIKLKKSVSLLMTQQRGIVLRATIFLFYPLNDES